MSTEAKASAPRALHLMGEEDAAQLDERARVDVEGGLLREGAVELVVVDLLVRVRIDEREEVAELLR